MNKLRSLPLIGFLIRYWMLLAFCAVGVSGCLNDTVFAHFGALMYVPAVCLMPPLLALAIRHAFMRETLDKYVAGGEFTREFWQQLTPWARQILCLGYFTAILLATAIVAAMVAK